MAVDLLGGDHAPAVVVDGALLACQADPALKLLLVGPVEAAGEVLAALDPADRGRVRSLAAAGTPVSHPAHAGWIESGVRAAVLAVAQGNADAVVSAGSTGATVTSAALGLGRWPGVRRPALAAVLPTVAGRMVLLDVGASVDPDEHTLATHALLGAAYASTAHARSAPRVGLLTIGTEPGKGDQLRRVAAAELARLDLPGEGRYIGLVEGNHVVTGDACDVVVTDGYTGNVLLKGLETAYATLGPPGAPDTVPPRAAVLLGVSGTVVVCHGAATGPDLAAGIALAADLHRRAAVNAIAALMSARSTHEVSDEQ
ncbi:phosphate acyltransferase PlsX [Jidongwangia harbinensis]|uniref:phosphate acyltransferase PlsX n=1 Tax=Jidongwangia harbinensis TaxID=2878561 RepID=UPI001CD9B97C|nr:phosphate acyltransferase PlsX [Jidongwangia harbinensis]MCA2215116.1 phosphate acyltransferase PlsX [Jidongwangia harbinensis]